MKTFTIRETETVKPQSCGTLIEADAMQHEQDQRGREKERLPSCIQRCDRKHARIFACSDAHPPDQVGAGVCRRLGVHATIL